MACDPNTLLEQAKCIATCVPPGMMRSASLAALCRIGSAPAGSNPSLTGLVAYWKMDEAGSIQRNDASGNAHHLSVAGTVNSGTGKINNGSVFNSNPANNLSNADPVFSGAAPFSVFFWVNFSALGNQILMAHGTSGGLGQGWEIRTVSGPDNVLLRTFDGAGAQSDLIYPTVLVTGTFFLVIVTFDDATHATIRVNNGADVSGVMVTPNNPAFSFRIGTDQVGVLGVGAVVDEVGVYSRILTSAEKDALWNAGAGKQYPFT